MSIREQLAYKDKMYKRNLGTIDANTNELYTPNRAMKLANESLAKKHTPNTSPLKEKELNQLAADIEFYGKGWAYKNWLPKLKELNK